MMQVPAKQCPCGSNKRYLECCGAFLKTKAVAETPEALMRSRYTAYVEKNTDYLRRTMKAPALLKYNKKEVIKGKEEWLGLEIISTSFDPSDAKIGYVEFIAKFKLNNKEDLIHEKSKFLLEQGKWYYVDGEYSL